jgi:methionyl-tRNA synthetase
MSKKILITSALPYVNNIPHLGNIIGCVLSADVYARFQRLIGNDVLYVCGTDEYGTATETKAKEIGVTPREICNKYHELHKEIYDWFNIDFDIFGRTSTENPKTDDWAQTKLCHEIFKDLVNNGHIIEKEIEQLYCNETKQFLADRYVKGTCPHCGYEDANGDQCDGCSKLYSATELINPYCKLNKKYKLEIKKSEHLFLKLGDFKDRLTQWWLQETKCWTNVANGITKSWLGDDLQDRCITRDLEWGTPVPDTEQFGNKYKDKVFYVWFDAPIGYISITANGRKDWKDWWMNSDTTLVNFMAKDNVPFHSIIFPAALMGTGKEYKLVNKLSAIDYLNYEDKKFSKSNNTGVFGDDAKESGICSDLWRYYLIKSRPENGDSCFTWEDFENKINGELVNNFSNLINRVLSLTYKNYKEIPEITNLDLFNKLNREYNNSLNNYKFEFNRIRLKEAINKFLEFSSKCNLFINNQEPWNKIRTNPEDAKNVLGILCHFLICLSVMVKPFIPDCYDKIQSFMNISHNSFALDINKFKNTKINKPKIIFKRIPNIEIRQLKQKYG